MKHSRKTDLWRFPIICEEIWTGVEKEFSSVQSNVFDKHISVENHHVPSSQFNTQQAQVIT